MQKATVTYDVRESGSFHSDQRAVWNEVSETLGELGVRSSTSDFREGCERVADKLEEFVEAIRAADNQVGAIFINARWILGLEMLGTPLLFSKVCEKVTRSFAFEALGAPDLDGVSVEAVRRWWDIVLESPFSQHASPGAGEDIRLGTEDLIGSGLIWNGALVHFSCFPIGGMEDHRPSWGRVSAAERRAVIMAQSSEIIAEDLEPGGFEEVGKKTLKEAREKADREIILRVLTGNKFNLTQSAVPGDQPPDLI